MSPERKPPNGELGGFTTADIAAAIAIESAEMLERVLRRLEMRDACDQIGANGKESRPQTPGGDFQIEIPWRGGENRVFRRVAIFPKMIGEKCHNWDQMGRLMRDVRPIVYY